MPDHFEELFADLRGTALPQVRPPGSEAARRTAGRRRRTRRGVTAAAVVMAVAGGLAVAVPPLREGHRVTAAARMRGLLDTAKRAVDSQLPDVAVSAFAQPVAAGRPVTFGNLPAGTYNLSLACAGVGTVSVEARLVRSGGDSAVLGGQGVSCEELPQATYLALRLPVAGSVVVTTVGDAPADGGAGFALDLRPDAATRSREAQIPASESTWNAERAAAVLSAAGRQSPTRVTTEQPLDAMHFTGPGLTAAPGPYDFELVCAGPGTLTVTVRTFGTGDGKIGAGETVLNRRVGCRDLDPRLDRADLLTLPANSGFALTVVPDDLARDRAGVAYHLRPQ